MPRILVATALFSVVLAGCSKSYTYELIVFVRDSVTGKTIEAVEISRSDGKSSGFPIKTDASGEATTQFKVSDIHFRGGSSNYSGSPIKLKLSKSGYEDETIDVSPKKPPDARTAQIVVFTYLREKK